jgi:hypothetical protein
VKYYNIFHTDITAVASANPQNLLAHKVDTFGFCPGYIWRVGRTVSAELLSLPWIPSAILRIPKKYLQEYGTLPRE